MAESVELSQPLPLRQLLDEAVRRARQHFRALYLPVALPLAVLWGSIPLIQQRWFKAFLPGAGGDSDPTEVLSGVVVMMVASLVFFSLQSLGAAALFVGALDGLAGREIQMSRAWKAVFRPKMLGTLAVRGVLLLFGFTCCVLPGIYLYLRWCFAIPVMVDEGRFGFSSLQRSGALTDYNPQREFGTHPMVKAFVVVFVGGLIGYVVNMVTTLPMIVAQQVLMFRALAGGQRPDPAALMEGMLWLQVPTQILAVLGQTAVEVYVVFGLALLFFDVKHRKEGQDLEAAIGALAARDAPA